LKISQLWVIHANSLHLAPTLLFFAFTSLDLKCQRCVLISLPRLALVMISDICTLLRKHHFGRSLRLQVSPATSFNHGIPAQHKYGIGACGYSEAMIHATLAREH